MAFDHALRGKHLVLGLSGGVAAYKAAELCRALCKARATVQVVMSEAATRFITPLTMQALSGRAVFVSPWDERGATDSLGDRHADHMAHIHLTRGADAVLLAPASADLMARLVQGRADDLLALLCLAKPASVPLIVAPAMNREMWAHPATQRNVAQLKADGACVLDVGMGDQACGEVGEGRMLEPADILDALIAHFTPKTLAGRRVVITAGPTYEAIDPVRGLTNRSSGKMGFALAQAAMHAGAEVTLIAGPVSLPSPRQVKRVDVQSALQMQAAVQAHTATADVFIATAAVADWRPTSCAPHKLKKEEPTHDAVTGSSSSSAQRMLSLTENPDILVQVAASERAQRGDLYCVGFAAESENLLPHTSAKRLRKGVPLLMGNIGPATFGQDDNALLLVDAQGTKAFPRAAKSELAQMLVREIAQRLEPLTPAPS